MIMVYQTKHYEYFLRIHEIFQAKSAYDIEKITK